MPSNNKADGCTVSLLNLVYRCHLGVGTAERRRVRKVTVDVHYSINPARVIKSDSLTDTVDYTLVEKSVKEVVTGRDWRTVEAMAGNIMKAVRMSAGVRDVSVEIRKPDPDGLQKGTVATVVMDSISR